jgi:hypothetical protein
MPWPLTGESRPLAGRPPVWHAGCFPEGRGAPVKQTCHSYSLALCLALGLGCSGKAFVRADPPISAQGLTIALTDQSCDLDQDPEQQGSYVEDVMLGLDLTNKSPSNVQLDRDRARLGWSRESVLPDQHRGSVSLKPGESTHIQIHFTPKGADVACNNGMKLDWSDAVTMDGKPVSLPPLTYQASSKPDS